MDIRINAHFGTIINFAFITVKRKITGLKQVLWQMVSNVVFSAFFV